jgi:hypothetical protein
VSEIYNWPDKMAIIHFPFVIFDSPSRELPKWEVGKIRSLLGHLANGYKLSDGLEIEVYTNGLFVFDFERTNLKSGKSKDFNRLLSIYTRRSQRINAFLACLHSEWPKTHRAYFGPPLLANASDIANVKGSGMGWGSPLFSLLWDSHKAIDYVEDLPDQIPRHFNHIPIRVVDQGANKYKDLIKKSKAQEDYDLYLLIDYLFRSSISLKEQHYDNVVIFSWIVVEASIIKLVSANMKELGLQKNDVEEFWDVSHIQEALRLIKVISNEENALVRELRRARNRLLHAQKSIDPTAKDLSSAVKLAADLTDRAFDFKINVNLSRSLNG